MKEIKKILIVEDEFVVAFDLKNSLNKYGYHITSIVNSGEKALLKAAADKPDLILMDINLRGKLNGLDAAKAIDLEYKIPIIFMTAYDYSHLLKQLNSKNFHLINKPYKHIELVEMIENLHHN